MPVLRNRTQQQIPVQAKVAIPVDFPEIPQEIIDRFPSAKDWEIKLQDFWDRTNQAIQEAQVQVAKQVNANTIYSVDSFRIYGPDKNAQPIFSLDGTGIRLGNVLVVNTKGRTVHIGVGEFANDNTPFYVDTLGFFSLGSSLTWNPDTDTLTITGIINATSGTIGGFEIGTDYIRDTVDSFGLASTVTVGDDIRFWAGATFAARATAPLHITEAGVLTARKIFISDVSGTTNRHVQWQTSGVQRWAWLCDSTAETGSNAGSNIALLRYSDAGAFLATSISVDRKTGIVFLSPENSTVFRWNGIGSTSTPSAYLNNDSSATAILQQWSPAIHMKGDGWKTAAGGAQLNCTWRIEVQPVTGVAAPYNPLVFSSDVSNTPSFVARVAFDSTGIQAAIGATTPNTGLFTTLGASGLLTVTIAGAGSASAAYFVAPSLTSGNYTLFAFGQSIAAHKSSYGAHYYNSTDANNYGELGIVGVGGALQWLDNLTVKIPSLAGVGSRAVMADANGVLSAP